MTRVIRKSRWVHSASAFIIYIMGFQLSLPGIVLIAVGGALTLGIALSVLAIGIVRLQQKCPSDRITALEAGRVDLASRTTENERFQKARNVLHRQSCRNPYSPLKSWASLHGPSTCAVEVPQDQSRALRYPKPIKLGRPGKPRLSSSKDVRYTHLPSITERYSPKAAMVSNAEVQKPSPSARTESQAAVSRMPANLDEIDGLTPAPLFHSTRRSVSAGFVVERDGEVDLFTTKEALDKNRLLLGPTSRRSQSLRNRNSSAAPEDPLPRLPSNMEFFEMQNLRNSANLVCDSMETSSSIYSSIIEPAQAMIPPMPITAEATKLADADPFLFNQSTHRGDWCSHESPTSIAKIFPQSGSQHSLQASIQQHAGTLTRSKSSSLSIALADKYALPQNEPSASRRSTTLKSFTFVYEKADEKASTGDSQATTEGNIRLAIRSQSLVVKSKDESRRHSVSTLQEISNNLGHSSLDKLPARPSPINTADIFVLQEPLPTGKAGRGPRSQGYKRQSRQRISFITPILPYTFTPTVEELEEDETRDENTRKGRPSNDDSSAALLETPNRPPSRRAFESHAMDDDRYYCSTMSAYNIYSPTEIDSEAFLSTPTQSPRKRPKRMGTNKALPILPSWPSDNSIAKTESSLPEDTSTRSESNVPATLPESPFSALHFPKPPPYPQVRARVIRGPRPISPRSSLSQPPRTRSPAKSRSPLRHMARASPQLTPESVVSSAIKLRRMNSDVDTLDSKESNLYVGMGNQRRSFIRHIATDETDPCPIVRSPGDDGLGFVGKEMMEQARWTRISLEGSPGKRSSGSILEKECF